MPLNHIKACNLGRTSNFCGGLIHYHANLEQARRQVARPLGNLFRTYRARRLRPKHEAERIRLERHDRSDIRRVRQPAKCPPPRQRQVMRP